MPTQRVGFFDIWRTGYNGASVAVNVAGTTTPANIFTDEALTVAASNPQTLSSYTENGVSYGKWAVPIYTSQAVELKIDNVDDTGIIRPPLITLDAQNASDALVTTTLGSESRALDERFDDVLHALDYGALGATAATNNTTLTAAIGAAASNGGGIVLLPEGTYEFTSLTLSAGVVFRGEGRGVTILQCQTGGNCITLSGDRAGLANLTFDGVTTVASSVGVYSKANNETVFDDVDIKRFVTGIHFKGGQRAAWRDLYLTNNTNGAKLHGDNDAGGGADGDVFQHNEWKGGVVSQHSGIGVDLSFEDKKCWHNSLSDVGFDSNTGTGIRVNGARFTRLPGCWFIGNTTAFAVLDDDDTDNTDLNTVIGLKFHSGMISGGAATLDDTCQDVVLEGMEITDVDFTLTSIVNNILLRDCIEDSLVTITGDGERITRIRNINKGASSGVTTDATVTKAWAITLLPGEIVYLTAKVIGAQRNGEGRAVYDIQVGAYRPGSTLDYDNQTANYTVGDVLTGGTSGATGRIIADSDGGSTGTLTLKDISGTFQNNETITDVAGGSALANGTVTDVNVALDTVGVTSARTAYETAAAWACVFAANGSEIELQVTGEAAKTIDWLCEVEVLVG